MPASVEPFEGMLGTAVAAFSASNDSSQAVDVPGRARANAQPPALQPTWAESDSNQRSRVVALQRAGKQTGRCVKALRMMPTR